MLRSNRKLCEDFLPLCFVFLLIIIGLTSVAGFSQIDSNGNLNPLFVDPDTSDFAQNPQLLERILSGPHGYFRFINIPFSQEVCRRFAGDLPGTPSFNLHGDAHIEQYAVTDLGRGLTDFDDSSTGPAVLDLLRFGVSLRLTCQANGWGNQTDALLDKFLFAYRLAITDPKVIAPEPGVVQKLRGAFKHNRNEYLAWVNSVMQPMPDDESEALISALGPYIEYTLESNEGYSEKFFEIIQVGYLRMGIGSALDTKYLLRVRGKSDKPADDVILEIKEVRDLTGIECITIPQRSDPFRVLLGQARIAYEPYKLLGYIRLQGRSFWIHAWVDNYAELDSDESFQSMEELAEVVFDVGIQLGQGHPKQIADPLGKQLRREQLLLLNKQEAKIKDTCTELTELTIAAWQQFSSKTKQSKNAEF